MRVLRVWLAVVIMAAVATCNAEVTIETMPVGNPGNTGELSGGGAGGNGPNRVCGAVDHLYSIGKYEVTAGQYTAFLNAVARTDSYALYNSLMWSSSDGCKIERSGSPGNYTYSVASDWANRPVNYVSWGDAARFCNWLHNGQPMGPQGPNTTEDGAYYLNEAISDTALLAVLRKPNWTWAIPTEDEWYKAAYHKNDGVTGHYFDYPTSSNAAPINTLPDPGNHANFRDYFGTGNGFFSIGSPYYRTPVGSFENSESPYGTFDQGGNVWEWNEAIILYSSNMATRGYRGGSFGTGSMYLAASYRSSPIWRGPTTEVWELGFRVTLVPEPTTLALLGIGVIGLMAYGWRRRTRPVP